MNKLGLIGGIGLGAFLMYIFDPLGGKRRRALAREKAIHLAHQTAEAIENRLEVHENTDSVPGFQGEPEPRKTRGVPDFMQATWSPATRFITGAASGALVWYGARQRNILGAAVASLGSVIGARALANMEFKRLIGLGAGRRAIDIYKTINVDAPVHEVFSFWTNYENFPRFMSNVREVTAIDENRSHWVVAGPGGVPVEWDALITDYVLNHRLGWKTVPGSQQIRHAGTLRFQPNPDGTTRLETRMSYNPVAGGLGHAVASLFGADPESQMEEDLMRMRTLIETGTPPHDSARVEERRAYSH